MPQESTDAAALKAKLDTIIKLLALSVASDNHSLKDRALRLQRAGLSPKEIAAICDTTPNTVSVALSAAKRETKAKAKKAR